MGRGNFGRQAASKEIVQRPGLACVLECGHRLVHLRVCHADRHYCWIHYASDLREKQERQLELQQTSSLE